ncbi:large conductance mechanosensitive channel protein MscL [Streptomyces sp. NPDC051662]|uniref:large conductance mechanosensitive channel protein MscL n=1 Tax=Streptomyces sp. NPDC051662 TaxID=3154750 RepID=UPI003419629C
MSKEKESVLEGFKAFLMRGNVIDLAVAVVIGAAFTNVVNSVVKGLINPVVGAFGTQDLNKYSSCLKSPCATNDAGEVVSGIPIMWGTVLSAVLTFLITAAVVYFLMVLPMSKYLARRARQQAAQEEVQEAADVSELEVLKEIRDTLIAQRGPGTAVPGQTTAGRTTTGQTAPGPNNPGQGNS